MYFKWWCEVSRKYALTLLRNQSDAIPQSVVDPAMVDSCKCPKPCNQLHWSVFFLKIHSVIILLTPYPLNIPFSIVRTFLTQFVYQQSDAMYDVSDVLCA